MLMAMCLPPPSSCILDGLPSSALQVETPPNHLHWLLLVAYVLARLARSRSPEPGAPPLRIGDISSDSSAYFWSTASIGPVQK
eukprot:5228013-Pyramimonas_sp.AAC.1